MSDDLPVEIGEDEPDGDESWGLFEWLLAAGGTVAAIYVLAWVFNILAWLAGYALQAALVVAVLYAAYKGIEYMLGGDSSSQPATMPEEEMEGELENLGSGGELESELEGLDELESTETADVKLGDLSEDDLEADLDSAGDLEDDALERKFAELEEQMSDE